MAANERQVGGSHYKTGSAEHWDMVVHFKLDYFQGQITKYVMRWREKGGVKDLKKAQHFLEKYIEVATDEEVAAATGKMVRKLFSLSAILEPGNVPPPAGGDKVSGQKLRPVRRKSKR